MRTSGRSDGSGAAPIWPRFCSRSGGKSTDPLNRHGLCFKTVSKIGVSFPVRCISPRPRGVVQWTHDRCIRDRPDLIFRACHLLLGLGVMVGIAWLISTNRRAIRWRPSSGVSVCSYSLRSLCSAPSCRSCSSACGRHGRETPELLRGWSKLLSSSRSSHIKSLMSPGNR